VVPLTSKLLNVIPSYTYIIPALYQNERCENVRSEKLMHIVLRDRGARNTQR